MSRRPPPSSLSRAQTSLGLLLLFAVLLGPARDAAARGRRRSHRQARHAWQRAALSTPHALTRAAVTRWRVDAYHDPKIDVHALNQKLERLAKAHPKRMKLTTLTRIEGEPIYRVDVAAAPPQGNKGKTPRPLRVLLSAGVHGNEPTGVRASIALLEKALDDKRLHQRFDLTFIPMVNPSGLSAAQRTNAHGQDINRAFVPGQETRESRALSHALGKERFDLAVDLHGAFRQGFFLIRARDDGTISQRILSAMPSAALLAPAPGEHAVGPYELSTRGGATSNNAGTLKGFMAERSTYSYTLEYPRRLPAKRQLSGLLRLVGSALNNVYRHGERREGPTP